MTPSPPPGSTTLPSPFPQEFYARPADVVAPELLGATLRVVGEDGQPRSGRIVEVEAYLGESDRACHAFRGLTKRTRSLYGPPGTAYVYLIYGVHELFNVVCEQEGIPHAVLVRAVELDGPNGELDGNGPGKLSLALGIDRRHDGISLEVPPVTIHPGSAPARVVVTPRVGVAYAEEWAALPLRYLDADSRAVSRPPASRIGLGRT